MANKVLYNGIDVSTWNGTIDWKKAKADGVQFVIIRAGYGKNNIDSKFKENIKNAAAAGVLVGAYWFSYAYTNEMARNEADYLCYAVKATGVKVSFPLYFDFEYDSLDYAKKHGFKATAANLASLADAFLSRVKERGYYPGNYTNPDFLARGFAKLNGKYDVWLAQWGVSAPSKECTMWQYKSTGRVNGMSGNVDMDVCYKDYPAIICGGVTPEPVNPVEPSKYKYGKASETTGILKKGSRNDGVKAVQDALNHLGYGTNGTANCDGVFGNGTETAVKNFQRAMKIKVDGKVGPQTREAFKKMGW